MKQRIIINLIIFLFLSSSINGFAQKKNKILDGGFSMKFIVGFVPNSFGWLKGEASLNREAGYLLGGQIGNRWYHHINNKMSFGAMINWLEVTTTKIKNNGESDSSVTNATLLATGPIFTYALTPKSGVDIFYNARPTIINDINLFVTHGIGLGLRHNVLMFNFEYIFGKVPSKKYAYTTPLYTNINHARISLGLKF